jgi:hypothetical protein
MAGQVTIIYRLNYWTMKIDQMTDEQLLELKILLEKQRDLVTKELGKRIAKSLYKSAPKSERAQDKKSSAPQAGET